MKRATKRLLKSLNVTEGRGKKKTVRFSDALTRRIPIMAACDAYHDLIRSRCPVPLPLVELASLSPQNLVYLPTIGYSTAFYAPTRQKEGVPDGVSDANSDPSPAWVFLGRNTRLPTETERNGPVHISTQEIAIHATGLTSQLSYEPWSARAEGSAISLLREMGVKIVNRQTGDTVEGGIYQFIYENGAVIAEIDLTEDAPADEAPRFYGRQSVLGLERLEMTARRILSDFEKLRESDDAVTTAPEGKETPLTVDSWPVFYGIINEDDAKQIRPLYLPKLNYVRSAPPVGEDEVYLPHYDPGSGTVSVALVAPLSLSRTLDVARKSGSKAVLIFEWGFQGLSPNDEIGETSIKAISILDLDGNTHRRQTYAYLVAS